LKKKFFIQIKLIKILCPEKASHKNLSFYKKSSIGFKHLKAGTKAKINLPKFSINIIFKQCLQKHLILKK
jgi:hypothetical protein